MIWLCEDSDADVVDKDVLTAMTKKQDKEQEMMKHVIQNDAEVKEG